MFREVCILVARQQGKTTIARPLIVQRLRAGRKIMHIAQNRNLPRIMFASVADAFANEPELFPKRRGRVQWPRFGAGQEEIVLTNGGTYRIAAASQGSARGHPNDDLIIDELREMESDEIMNAAESTVAFSTDPQIVYLSNAGTATSMVLNAVRARAGADSSLAYLEWSAAPNRAALNFASFVGFTTSVTLRPSIPDALNIPGSFGRASVMVFSNSSSVNFAVCA